MQTITKEVDFFKRPFKESIAILTNKLSGSCLRILELFSASTTFHDEVVFMPPAKEIAKLLDMGLSTVYTAFKKIKEKIPFLSFQTNSQFTLAYRTNPDKPKKFFNFFNQELIPFQKNYFQKYRNNSSKAENKQLELPFNKDSPPPQTIQKDQIPQTEEGVEELVNKEEQEKVNSLDTEEKSKDNPEPPQPKPKKTIPPNVAQKKYKIPEELLERLRMARVGTSEQVLVAISKHHLSQAYGAVTHVENTWSTIQNSRAVFLYQLPRQPIEQLGQRYPDEFLEKRKADIARIEAERAKGVKSFKDMLPKSYKIIERLREKAQKNSESPPRGEDSNTCQ